MADFAPKLVKVGARPLGGSSFYHSTVDGRLQVLESDRPHECSDFARGGGGKAPIPRFRPVAVATATGDVRDMIRRPTRNDSAG